MTYGGVDFLAILIATVAGMACGPAWYGVLSKPWMAAAGLTEADIKGHDGRPGGGPAPYLVALFAKFVMAFCLARLLAVLDALSIGNAVAAALFLWIGFVAAPLAVNHRFQMRPWSLTLIDGGYWLLVMIVQGVVIGWFGQVS